MAPAGHSTAPVVGQRQDDPNGGDDGDPPDGPRSLGYSVEKLNKEYAVVMVGGDTIVFHEQPQARQVEHRLRMVGLAGFKTWFRNRFTEFRGRDGKIKRVTWANAWLDAGGRRQYQGDRVLSRPE